MNNVLGLNAVFLAVTLGHWLAGDYAAIGLTVAVAIAANIAIGAYLFALYVRGDLGACHDD
jgi:CBS-domain-containing membrane protein